MIAVSSPTVTYTGCKACKQKYHENAPACGCAAEAAKFWRAEVLLSDGSAQVTAIVFDALADVAEAVLECDEAETAHSMRDPELFGKDQRKRMSSLSPLELSLSQCS